MAKLTFSCLLLALITVTLFNAVYGIGEACDDDTFCNEHNNERCQKYDACAKGRCVCQPMYLEAATSPGICRKVARIGESCNTSTSLPEGSTCGSGVNCNATIGSCACLNNKVGDYDCYNLRKVNGEACSLISGCNTDVGLMCIDSVCVCPTSHTWVASVYNPTRSSTYSIGACVHKHAKYGLSEGDRCSTSGVPSTAGLYCGKALVCSRCPEENRGTAGGSNSDFNVCLKTAYSGGKVLGMDLWMLSALLAVSLYHRHS